MAVLVSREAYAIGRAEQRHYDAAICRQRAAKLRARAGAEELEASLLTAADEAEQCAEAITKRKP